MFSGKNGEQKKNGEAGREREINAIEVKCSETFSEKPVLHSFGLRSLPH